MARYVIRLYVALNQQCGIERVIRREGDDRAILYAQNWLHKHRLSMRYLGIAFDRWSVAVESDAEISKIISSGVDDRRVPTAKEEQSRRRASQTRLRSTGAIDTSRRARPRVARSTPARPMSRLAQAMAAAKQKVANNGLIPPLGGNQNGQG